MLKQKEFTLAFQRNSTSIELLKEVVRTLRPKNKIENAEVVLREFTEWLKNNIGYKYQLREAIVSIVNNSELEQVLSESGLPTGSGFFAELRKRLSEKLLPNVLNETDLRYSIRQVFDKSNDFKWVEFVSDSTWFTLFKTLKLNVVFVKKKHLGQVVKAGDTLAYRIAALGLDRNLTDKYGNDILKVNAFVNLHKNWELFADSLLHAGTYDLSRKAHLDVVDWLRMSKIQVYNIRRTIKEYGTSLQLSYLLEKIEQYTNRLLVIVKILEDSIDLSASEAVSYFKGIVKNENTQNKLGVFLSMNFSYLAYEISEHGSKTGEKYITNNYREWIKFIGAACVGGFIISFAAFIKVLLTDLHQPYFWASFTYGFNYALAFVIIHLLHGSIATKQPALTASAIATALDTNNKTDEEIHASSRLYNLAVMNAKVFRSQLASLIGNLIIVLPLTVLIAFVWERIYGHNLIPFNSVDDTLKTILPSVENIWYAAIAGVLLFASGIISGFFDNSVINGNIPLRLKKHKRLRWVFGERKLERIANYIEKNLGALMGNIILGFGLGFMIFFGKILGLPLDIRHVTISTGFFGFSLMSANFTLPLIVILKCIIGLGLIAFTNLTVSFTLALIIAMKSRKVPARSIVPLIRLTLKYFVKHPTDFFFPPKKERVPLGNEEKAA